MFQAACKWASPISQVLVRTQDGKVPVVSRSGKEASTTLCAHPGVAAAAPSALAGTTAFWSPCNTTVGYSAKLSKLGLT